MKIKRIVFYGINTKDKIGKWLMGTVGFVILSAILSGIMTLILQ